MAIVMHTYEEFFKKLSDVTVAREFLDTLVKTGYRIEIIPDPQSVQKLTDEMAVDISKKLFPTYYLNECPPPNDWRH